MKLGSLLPIFAFAAFTACGGQGPNSASIKDSHKGSPKDSQVTVNDLPTVIMSCLESTDGVVIADAGMALDIGKDQFGQISARIVQLSFLGASVIADFVGIEGLDPAATFPAGVPKQPDLIYFGSNPEPKSRMTLSLWKDADVDGRFDASLHIAVEAPYLDRTATMRCWRY